jgi:hypothetical protein
LHDEELHNLYSRPKNNHGNKIKKEAVVDLVQAWKRQDKHTEFWHGKEEESNPLEGLGSDGRIKLKCIYGDIWIGFNWLKKDATR